jgi:hypothetical protein
MAPGEPRDGEAVSRELVLVLRGQRRCQRIASHYVGTSKVGILPCCPTSRSSVCTSARAVERVRTTCRGSAPHCFTERSLP